MVKQTIQHKSKYTPLPEEGGKYTVLPLSVCPSARPSVLPSFRPSKIFVVAFFSVTVDGRNLIFGHKRHIGIPYRGKRFFTLSVSYFLFAEEQGYHK